MALNQVKLIRTVSINSKSNEVHIVTGRTTHCLWHQLVHTQTDRIVNNNNNIKAIREPVRICKDLHMLTVLL